MLRNRISQLLQANKATAGKAFRAAKKSDTAELYLYDVIDPMFGIGAEAFVKALKDIDAKTLHLHINSPGGDVFEARAMVSALKAFEGTVIAFVDGLAASAASYVALAASEVRMSKGAMLMIHRAWTLGFGNTNDFVDLADLLAKIDSTIADDYAAKTGESQAAMLALMDAETWMTADEAVVAKFADVVVDEKPKDSVQWDLSAYAHAPKIDPPAPIPEPEDDTNATNHANALERFRHVLPVPA